MFCVNGNPRFFYLKTTSGAPFEVYRLLKKPPIVMLYIDHLLHSYNPCAVVTIAILSRQQLPLPYLMNSEPCEGTNTTTSS